jgi:hypothetical protein
MMRFRRIMNDYLYISYNGVFLFPRMLTDSRLSIMLSLRLVITTHHEFPICLDLRSGGEDGRQGYGIARHIGNRMTSSTK